jgi:chromosome segregation ATPase
MKLTFTVMNKKVCGNFKSEKARGPAPKSTPRIKGNPSSTATKTTVLQRPVSANLRVAPRVSMPSVTPSTPVSHETVVSAPVSHETVVSAPVSHETVVNEIVQSIPKTNTVVDAMKDKLVSFIRELDKDQVKNENESRANVNRVSDSLQSEQDRIDTTRATLKKLYDETERLNATIQTHYKQMIDDAKYLKSLDDMRPGFLKSLGELASHIKTLRDDVDKRLVKDEYKDEMITLLTDLHFNTHNISGFVASAFMNHYNRYQSRVQNDNSKYSADIKEMNSLAIQYQEQSKKMVELEKERSRLQDILARMNETLSLSVSQRQEFDKLAKELAAIFEKSQSLRC